MKDSFHYMLMMTHNKFSQEIVHKAREINLMPGQPKVLEYLSSNDGCTQKDIGEGCALNKATINGILTRMELNELISREQDVDDKRKTIVNLTNKGRLNSEAVENMFSEVEEIAWKDIKEEDKNIFMEVLKKIYFNLENELDK